MLRTPLSHEAIAASAGSGKTFQLAHRYLRLLAEGVPPDRIIALTFSRKAAGEIFDSVAAYLCRACESDAEAAATAARIGMPDTARATFATCLRTFLFQLHRVHIGTLDSFLIGVVRAFPLELGIRPDFRVLDNDGADARELHREVLGGLFSPRRAGLQARRAFLEAFKRATFGQEEKAFERTLDALVGEFRSVYRALPQPEAWAAEERLWPDGNPLLRRLARPAAVAGRLLAFIDAAGYPDALAASLVRVVRAAGAYDERSRWDTAVENKALETLTGTLERLRRGHAMIEYRRRSYPLADETARAFAALVGHLLGVELRRSLEQTRGLYDLLDRYDAVYDDVMRSAGRLTFDDAQYLLAGGDGRGAVMSRAPGGTDRLFIDYRLDCRLDHWLLDEFQDTSDLQWAALANLADETLQDSEGRRTFFYVGDVKQAIYGWRGGNARLFDAILRTYGDRIRRRPLNTSFRSAPPVIEAVNTVFGGLRAAPLPDETLARWEATWEAHRCEEGKVPPIGYAALVEPRDAADGGARPGAEDRYRLVARLLDAIDPVARGLSAAVLVRSNRAGHAVVDLLRRECPGRAVVHEGEASIMDNPVVPLLCSLLRFAAHPGDRFALRHVQMSPLGPRLAACGSFQRLPVRLLEQLQADGFRAFLSAWGAALDAAGALDAFGRGRLDDLLEAAGDYDSGGERDVDGFLRHVERYRLREAGGADAVRVMTVHQAKGLGFDVVLLPDLMAGAMDRGSVPLAVHHNPLTETPEWALRMPRRCVAQADPVLAAEQAAIEASSAFDALCVLYVAMTRAKRALYMVTSESGPSSKALTEAVLLKLCLAGDRRPTSHDKRNVGNEPARWLYETGDPDWVAALPPPTTTTTTKAPPPEPPAALPEDFASRPSRRRRLPRTEPSAAETRARPLAGVFDPEHHDVLTFGSAIHELLERVAWSEEADAEAILSGWTPAADVTAAVRRDVAGQFRAVLAAPDVRRALARPRGRAALWREKRFEAVIDGRWVSGAFDRVILRLDDRGRPAEATILDYKSNRIATDEEMRRAARLYTGQLDLYARALAVITGLAPDRIHAALLFTRTARIFHPPELRGGPRDATMEP